MSDLTAAERAGLEAFEAAYGLPLPSSSREIVLAAIGAALKARDAEWRKRVTALAQRGCSCPNVYGEGRCVQCKLRAIGESPR